VTPGSPRQAAGLGLVASLSGAVAGILHDLAQHRPVAPVLA